LPMNILVQSGSAVTASDLKAFLNKKPAKILSVTPDTSPHRIIILIDASSSSMNPPLLWRAFLALSSHLVENLPAKNTTEIAAFSEKLGVVVPFTDDRQKLQEGITNLLSGADIFLGPHRGTALFDSVVAAANLLSPGQGENLIYIFTDGGENLSSIRTEDALKILQSRGTKLFVFSIMAGSDKYPEMSRGSDLAAQRKLQEFAAKTGGVGVLVAGETLQRNMRLVERDGNPTALGLAWMDIPHLTPILFRLRMESTQQPKGKMPEFELRGPSPAGVEIDYRTRLDPCPTQ
jgi:hypothetical protein